MHCLQNRFNLVAFFGILLFLLFHMTTVHAETSVFFTPAAPQVGDYVDVTVVTDSDCVQGVRYHLSRDDEKLFFSKKAEKTMVSSFRPRKEGIYTLEVTVLLSGKRTENVSVSIPVFGIAPDQCGPDVVYSQKDGWWHSKTYSKDYNRTLESSGCAVFAVSHALQRLGFNSDATLPDRLAHDYHKCYIEGIGTGTEALITQTGLSFGFDTLHNPVRNENEIASFLNRGDLFCFGIVSRHVVLADGFDPKSRKVHVVDSAPGITFSKLKSTPVYIRNDDGSWQTILSAKEIPGIRWFFETSQFGGAEYWLDLKDCAARGMRLIRRPWLTMETNSGIVNVVPDSFDTEQSTVVINNETVQVNTCSLNWFCDGADKPSLAVTVKDRAILTSRNGTPIEKYLPLQSGSVLAVLWIDEELVYVYWRGTYGYLRRSDIELVSITR
ncbi:MAG: hypothetical protein IJI09_08410 [Clostridia bacterium]|nr:hypothetical protein [Clostridia bacterium]